MPCAGSASAAARSPRSVRPRSAAPSVLDAKGLVVAPGFIDLHAHGQSDESYRLYAMNGVTTALELEAGTHDVPAWYAAREGKSLLNYGVSSSHLQSRARVFNDPGQFLPDRGRGQRRRHTGADRGDRGAREGRSPPGRPRRRHGAPVHAGRDQVGSARDLPRGGRREGTGLRAHPELGHQRPGVERGVVHGGDRRGGASPGRRSTSCTSTA